MRGVRVKISAGSYPLAFLAGAILGTAWDRMHAAAGTLAYAHTDHLQPWWVPVEFGAAAVLIMLGVRNAGDPVPTSRSPLRALWEVLWFSLLYGLTALLWKRPEVLVVVLAVALVLRVSTLQDAGRSNAVPAMVLVVAGPAIEAVFSGLGLFRYARADLWGFPIWLPLLYMNAVPLAVRATEAFLWLPRKREAVEPDRLMS